MSSDYSHWYEDDKHSKPKEEVRRCDAPGCHEKGEHKAPKERPNGDEPPREFFYFCLNHVKEYNKKWDYFAGMKGEDIEHYRREAVTGHRPTWKLGHLGQGFTRANLEAKLYSFMRMDGAAQNYTAAQAFKGKTRKDMAALDIEWPFDERGLKKHYKALVKKHHPDVNPNNPQAEDTFKRVTQAYHSLLRALQNKDL